MANAESGEISKIGFNKTQTIKISFWRLDLTFCPYFQGNRCSKLLSATPLAALNTHNSAGVCHPETKQNLDILEFFYTHAKHTIFMVLLKLLMDQGRSVSPYLTQCRKEGCDLLSAAFCSKACCVEISYGVRGGNVFLLNSGQIRQPSLKQSSHWVPNGIFPWVPLLGSHLFFRPLAKREGVLEPNSFCRQSYPCIYYTM